MGLITKEVEVGLKSQTIKYYEDKGYIIPRIKNKYGKITVIRGTKIKVKPNDLTDESCILVKVFCDCPDCTNSTEKDWKWSSYKHSIDKYGKAYCKKCIDKIFSKPKELRTKLNNNESFGYWLIKNLSLKEAVEIISRWDEEKNNCDIRNVSHKSKGINGNGYWFKCKNRPEHLSELRNIASITVGRKHNLNCIVCNSIGQYLIDNYGKSALKLYWDYKNNINKNGVSINPFEISIGSEKKINIFCQEHKHHGSYTIQCSSFAKGCRCPYCNGKKVHLLDSLGTLHPEVLKIWSDKNTLSPYNYMSNSIKYIWWKCAEGKHEDYKRRIVDSNKSNFRCPECVQKRDESFLQEKVRLHLESFNFIVLHEYNCTIIPINPKTGNKKGQLPFDNEIIINNVHLIIEVHGYQHYKMSSWYKNLAKRHNTTPEYELHHRKLIDRYKKFIVYKQGYKYLEISYKTDNKEETWKQLINDKINEIKNSVINNN